MRVDTLNNITLSIQLILSNAHSSVNEKSLSCQKMIKYFFNSNRLNYVFIIGKGNKPFVSLPKGKGVKLSIAEERNKRIAAKAAGV